MSLTHIFFDLDGTLVDSSEGIHNGFVQTFERLGRPILLEARIKALGNKQERTVTHKKVMSTLE